jgi:hypothetical protein
MGRKVMMDDGLDDGFDGGLMRMRIDWLENIPSELIPTQLQLIVDSSSSLSEPSLILLALLVLLDRVHHRVHPPHRRSA